MVFSSVTFFYYFLPVVLAVYFITPMPKGSPRLRNIVLLVASLVFYAWGEPVYVLLFAVQCVAAWVFGLLIDKHRGKAISRVLMGISVAITLSALLLFKYADFFLRNLSSVLRQDIGILGLALPIGISFYTFQILSYTFDLYRGKTEVNRNVLDFSTFVAMFPQLIAGPIVRYSDVAERLLKRKHRISDIAPGIRRFVIGLGKKVLIANVMGEIVAIYKTGSENSTLFTWFYIVAFCLQLYFDFSGYSDMAIGMGRMLGFKFLENFNYPYIAKSITDFWRRWHISLSTWFRDYVYFPLGGSRVPLFRSVFNILFVWFLIGFWHGADWNFIVWGLYFAVLLLAEKFFLSKVLEKMPGILRHIYVIALVLIGRVFFDASDMAAAGSVFARMFGFASDGAFGPVSLYYLRSYLVPLVIGVVGCTPIPKMLMSKLSDKKAFTIIEPLAIGALLIVITA